MQQVIRFTTQNRGDGACGKYAIQHALLALGIPVSQRAISKATRLPPIVTRAVGTGPSRIIRALEYFGCRAAERTADSALAFRKELDVMLAKGYPCIISVEAGSHWAVIAGRSHAGYWWIDSADEEVIGGWSWKKIDEWIDNDEYYLIGVKPKNTRQLKLSLVPMFGRIAAQLEDEDLREYWGYYLEDLLEVFDSPSGGKDVVGVFGFIIILFIRAISFYEQIVHSSVLKRVHPFPYIIRSLGLPFVKCHSVGVRAAGAYIHQEYRE